MPKSLEAREVIIYLHVIKKGVWEDVYKAISEKEALPSDLDACRRVVNKFLSKHPNVVTIVDPAYPDVMKRRKHPAFVVSFAGDLGVIEYDQIIALETEALSPALTNHGLRHAFLDDNGWCHIRIPRLDISTGEYSNKELVLEDDRKHSIFTMIALCRKAVAINGEEDFSENFRSSFHEKELYALPGNSGCACNKLIKSGWHLCDSWQDLVFDDDPVDPKPRGED